MIFLSHKHEEYESMVYTIVSLDNENEISFSGLPKSFVDYFDFAKYENFENLESKVVDYTSLIFPNVNNYVDLK